MMCGAAHPGPVPGDRLLHCQTAREPAASTPAATASGTQPSRALLAPFVTVRRTCSGVACHTGAPTAAALVRSCSFRSAPAELTFCRAAMVVGLIVLTEPT